MIAFYLFIGGFVMEKLLTYEIIRLEIFRCTYNDITDIVIDAFIR
ncbi:Uncharacterised protein [Lacrimispora sphenoides]|uniref:Uncharacterized protein n=1 Tax=Lacrimispora sphenoides JCM 1415 TaxID=1297793 RepID=A0ABY1CH00_9FIRM|nr:hypothetical protein SAMN02745906_4272 [[Clostridium] sphenoides JCM 1415]SUY48849.1 Uncharacterised protein [Lacrimispora sphenoides]